jgi:hypothetical protein
MNNEANLQPPSSTIAKPKRKWRWLKFLVGTVAATFLAISLLGIYNSPKLEVRRQGAILSDDGKVLEVINVGSKPITLIKIGVNERSDCKISRFSLVNDSSPLPAELKIGDKLMLISSCRIIRTTFDTDQGSSTYSFSGE